MRGSAVVTEAGPLTVRLGVLGRFSPARDATLGAIVDAALGRGHDVVVLDIADVVRGPCRFVPGDATLTLGDVALCLDDLDALLLGPLPAASARLAKPGTTLDVEHWDTLAKRQAARHALGWSVPLVAEARGVPVLSSPSRARPFDLKPFQLAMLQAAGIVVPATVVSDHADDQVGIVKPLVGGPVVAAADHSDVRGAPVIRQPRLAGRQLRLAVIDGVVVAAAAIDLPDGVIDSRRSTAPWHKVVVDDALQDLGAHCARTCHFDVCAIDVIETAAGRVVLDVNRTPQLMDLAATCDVDIAGAVVDLLVRRQRSSGRCWP